MSLEALGADAALRSLFEPFAARGLVLARVAVAQCERYRLLADSGEYDAEPAGALLFHAAEAAALPVTGDWVAARAVGPRQAIVEAVLPRKTLFSRQAPGRRQEEQPVAANIDLVFLVCGLDGDFNLRRLERYLTLAARAGAEPVVVLNKADLCPGLASRMAEAAAVAGGAPVAAASATRPGGLDDLAPFLAYGRTVALLGSSGVGKSAIVNGLLGEQRLRTGEVRESDSRGRHTTTRRELIPLAAGGALIDTPGMRELQLWAGQESVEEAFGEIAALARGCRFRDCSHSGESGCAVAEAAARGALDAGRWNSYRKLMAEARRHEETAAERKRRDKALAKRIRAFYRGRPSG